MRYLGAIPIMVLLFTSCAVVQNAETPDEKTVRYIYQDIIFEPESKLHEIKDGLFLEIIPIDAIELNERAYRSAIHTGNYERDMAQEQMEFDIDDLSRSERIIHEKKKEADTKIRELIRNEEIPSVLGDNLIERLWGDENVGRDGSEVETASGQRFTPYANPYYYGENYLSLFELNFENISDEIRTIYLDKFQIAGGGEIIYPLKIEYFERRFFNNPVKLENAYRYNMPDSLRLSPGKSAKKILAVPAIDTDIGRVVVEIFNVDMGVNGFGFDLLNVSEDIETVFINYTIEPTREHDRLYYYSVMMEDGTVFSLKDDSFFVAETERYHTVNICIAEVPTSSFGSSEVECKKVFLGDFPSKIISF